MNSSLLHRLMDTVVVSGRMDEFYEYEYERLDKCEYLMKLSNVDIDWLLRYIFSNCSKAILMQWIKLINLILDSVGSSKEKQECFNMIRDIMEARRKYLLLNNKKIVLGFSLDLEWLYDKMDTKEIYKNLNKHKVYQSLFEDDKIKIGSSIYILETIKSGWEYNFKLRDIKTNKSDNIGLSMIIITRDDKVKKFRNVDIKNIEDKKEEIRKIGLKNINLIVMKHSKNNAGLLGV